MQALGEHALAPPQGTVEQNVIYSLIRAYILDEGVGGHAMIGAWLCGALSGKLANGLLGQVLS